MTEPIAAPKPAAPYFVSASFDIAFVGGISIVAWILLGLFGPKEYSERAMNLSIVLMCAMCSILFLGGWLSPINIWPLNIPALGIFWFLAKICFFFFMFAMVKAMVPRYRYDQLMRLGWKIFLPLSLFFVFAISGYLMATHHFCDADQTLYADPAEYSKLVDKGVCK